MPTFTQSHYQRYKTDTTQFSTWLVKTAISLGYPTDALTPCDSEGESPDYTKSNETRTAAQVRNAQKKARRKAKDRAAKEAEVDQDHSQAREKEEVDGKSDGTPTSASSKTPPSGSYALKVGQYIQLATHLIDKQHPIPIEVVRILRRCIRLRRRATERFAATSDPANGTHQHFVDALQAVLSLFSANLADCTEKGAEVEDIDLRNRFEELSVEDSPDEEDTTSDIQLPGVSPNDALRASLDQSLDDAVIQVIIFLEEVQHMRAHIRAIWGDFKEGKIDLMTAAVTTDTALELLVEPKRRLMNNTYPVFRHNMEDMFMATLSRMGIRLHPVDPAISTPDARYTVAHFTAVNNDNDCTAYEFAHVPIVQMLKSVASWAKDAEGFPTEELSIGSAADTFATPVVSLLQSQWRRSYTLLMESLTDLAFVLGHGKIGQARPSILPFTAGPGTGSAFGIGELTKQMRRFLTTSQWDYLMIAAFAIFLDINHVLRDRTAEGMKQLRKTGLQLADGLGRGLTAHNRQVGRYIVSPSQADEEYRVLHAELAAWGTFDLKSYASQAPAIQRSGGRFIDRNPTFCGLLAFTFRILYQEIGLGFDKTSGITIGVIHLNHALRFLTPEIQPWQAMDTVVELQGSEHIFAGPAPTTIDAALESFLDIAGAPEFHKNIAKDTRGTFLKFVLGRPLPKAQSQPRMPTCLRPSEGMLAVFRQSVFPDLEGPQDHLKSLQALLAGIHRDERSRRLPDSAGEAKDQSSQMTSGSKVGRRLKKPRYSKVSTCQLFELLPKSLEKEMQQLKFDYVSLHLRSFQLLREMRTATQESLGQTSAWQTFCEIGNEVSLVLTIIQLAAMESRRREPRCTTQGCCHSHTTARGLQIAVDVLRDFVKREGEDGADTKMVERQLV